MSLISSTALLDARRGPPLSPRNRLAQLPRRAPRRTHPTGNEVDEKTNRIHDKPEEPEAGEADDDDDDDDDLVAEEIPVEVDADGNEV